MSNFEGAEVAALPPVLASHPTAEDLSRPRAKYFLYYPGVLAASALLLWIFPTDLITGISSGIATVIACLMMWEYLFTNPVIRLSNLSATGLVIGYGAGTFNSWLTLTRGHDPLATAIGQTVPELANGVAAVLMGCAVLLFLGELFETPVVTIAQQLTITSGVKRLIVVSSAIIAIALADGRFHQGGAKTAGAHHAGVSAVFLAFLLAPTVVLATVAFLVEEVKTQKYLLGGLVLFLWVFQVTQSRRELVYPALVLVGLARFSGYRWEKITLSRVILVGAGIMFLFVGVLTYQLLRLAGYAASSESLSAETHQAQEWVKQGRAWRMATSSSIQNVKSRTLIVVFLSDMLYREKTAAPAFGKDLLLQTELAIPSLIDKDKPTISEEDLASRTFGVFYPDESNSVFTAAALDFGMWGIVIYPIAIILLMSAFLRLALGYFSFEVFYFGLALFLDVAIQAELQIDEYFGTVRNLLIFAVFLYFVSRMPMFQRKSG